MAFTSFVIVIHRAGTLPLLEPAGLESAPRWRRLSGEFRPLPVCPLEYSIGIGLF
jgi:hypothetical protein